MSEAIERSTHLSADEFLAIKTGDRGVFNVYLVCFAQTERLARENFVIPPSADFHDTPMPLDYNFFILRNEFRTILVDTGFSPQAGEARGRKLIFDPIDGLSRIGIDAESIDDIIITHLHYDHAGNIGRFPNARLHVQDAEVAFATGRCMCSPFFRFPFDVEDIVALVRRTFEGRVQFYDGDAEFDEGISLFAFPGHSASVQAVRVMTPRGHILLASDASHYFANVLNMAPFILSLDTPKTVESYHRMMRVAGDVGRLIPGHDPQLRRIYPKCSVNGIDLYALHEQPSDLGRARGFAAI